jgi:hypothetical protein
VPAVLAHLAGTTLLDLRGHRSAYAALYEDTMQTLVINEPQGGVTREGLQAAWKAVTDLLDGYEPPDLDATFEETEALIEHAEEVRRAFQEFQRLVEAVADGSVDLEDSSGDSDEDDDDYNDYNEDTPDDEPEEDEPKEDEQKEEEEKEETTEAELTGAEDLRTWERIQAENEDLLAGLVPEEGTSTAVATVPKNLAGAVADYRRIFDETSQWIAQNREAIAGGTASAGVITQLNNRIADLRAALERLELLAKTKDIVTKQPPNGDGKK